MGRKTEIATEGQANAAKTLGPYVHLAPSAEEWIRQRAIIARATPWPEFLSILTDSWARTGSRPGVIDCWRALKHLEIIKGIRHLGLDDGVV